MVEEALDDVVDHDIVEVEIDGTESPEEQKEAVIEIRKGRKRDRSVEGRDDSDRSNKKKPRLLSRSSQSISRWVRPLHEVVPGEGLRDSAQKIKAIKLARKSCKKRNKEARRGEADRVIPNLKPKHIYSGKRSNGKTQRR